MNIYSLQDHPRQQPSITIPLHHVNDLIQMSFFLIKRSNLLKKGRERWGPRSPPEPCSRTEGAVGDDERYFTGSHEMCCVCTVKGSNSLAIECKCSQRKFKHVLPQFDRPPTCEQLSCYLTYAWLFTLKSLLKPSQQTSDQPLLAVFDFFIRQFYSN